jgi:glycosyltransferase involved in cell wall biosynthesis
MKKSKPTLLLISAISPFPKDSGGAVRIYNTLAYLSNYFQIVFFFFKSPKYQLSDSDTDFLKKKTIFYTSVDIKTFKSPVGIFTDFQPYWFTDWLDDEIKIIIPRLIKEYSIDAVQLEFTQLCYLYKYIPQNIKKIFVAHDISSTSFQRRLREISSPRTKIVHTWRWIEVYLYERFFLKKFDLVTVMSQADKETAEKKFSVKKIYVAPNGIEKVTALDKQSSKEIKLGYIGSFFHSPNQFAIKYFIKSIAPLLEKNNVNYKFYIAGNNDAAKIKNFILNTKIKDKNRIINIGRVDNVTDFYTKINALVAPIFSGSGTRIKILESLSFGTPVITTTVGAEGLDDLKSDALKIADTDEEFVEAIKKINSDKTIIDSSVLLENYKWKTIFEKYASYIINDVLKYE